MACSCWGALAFPQRWDQRAGETPLSAELGVTGWAPEADLRWELEMERKDVLTTNLAGMGSQQIQCDPQPMEPTEEPGVSPTPGLPIGFLGWASLAPQRGTGTSHLGRRSHRAAKGPAPSSLEVLRLTVVPDFCGVNMFTLVVSKPWDSGPGILITTNTQPDWWPQHHLHPGRYRHGASWL